MKNLKVKLSMLALILGLGTAFATVKQHDPSDHKWARDAQSGLYTDITGQEQGEDYECNGLSNICTATYAEGVNPNTTPSAVPLDTEAGEFQQ